MIQTTNNAKKFFDDESASPIYIYGVGNGGGYVSNYMTRCNMDFCGYIDKAAGDGMFGWYEKPVIHPASLSALPEESIRIVITVGNPESAIVDLHWFADDKKMLCLTPLYNDVVWGNKVFDINRLLAYFRKKCLKVQMPTILSNTCNAGLIYYHFDADIMNSPTINTPISPDHFLKLCKNPEIYFSEELEFLHSRLWKERQMFAFRLGDIEILFDHAGSPSECSKRWNVMRKLVDYDNLVFIFEEDPEFWTNIPYRIAEEFCSLPQKHLLLITQSVYTGLHGVGRQGGRNTFHSREWAYENWFDIVGWLNGEFEI